MDSGESPPVSVEIVVEPAVVVDITPVNPGVYEPLSSTYGNYTVKFAYCGGNKGLILSGVSVLADGKQAVALSETVGIDTWNGGRRMRLYLSAATKGARYTLQLRTTVPKDTVVKVRLMPD